MADEAEASEVAAGGLPPGEFSLSDEQVAGIIQAQIENNGLVVVPPEIATEIGQQAVAKVMANRQVEALTRDNQALRRKMEVMETDMAVLHARLQEAGLEEAPTPEGAEVAPASPFPGEPGGEAGGGQDNGADGKADLDAVTP